jgi:hypothetical protein
MHDQAKGLTELVMGGDPDDPEVREQHQANLGAQFDDQHAEWLNEFTTQIVDRLRRLDKADRDHVLAAIDRQLMEAR